MVSATGFIWPDPGRVVTALHAVAGCDPANSMVSSEFTKDWARIVSFDAASLEADLALVTLERDMGLPAATFAGQPPDVFDEHLIFGYPLSARQIIGDKLRFALGPVDGSITLGRAFSSPDLDKLFAGQSYPTPDTQILRVTSTLQPGQSGAPIFNEDGKVVAIADGGLLGGWRGVNWSIPAHVYLPRLLTSDDDFPTVANKESVLHNAFAVEEELRIPLQSNVATSEGNLAGTLTLADLFYEYALTAGLFFDEGITVTPENVVLVARPTADDHGPVVLPATMKETQDSAPEFLEFANDSDNVYYLRFTYTGETPQDTFQAAREMFLEVVQEFDVPGTADIVPLDAYDETLAFTVFASDGAQDLDDTTSMLRVFFDQNLNDVVAQIIYLHEGFSDADLIDFRVTEGVADYLNGQFPMPLRLAAKLAERPRPQTTLQLRRRVPLSRLQDEIITDGTFQWKRELSELTDALFAQRPDLDLDDVTFDIYEDSATGATVASPTGIALSWDEGLAAVVGEAHDGKLRMAISVMRAPDFLQAARAAQKSFLPNLAHLAYWNGNGPSACFMRDDPQTQESRCTGQFFGRDRVTEDNVTADVKVTVRGTYALATAVYYLDDAQPETDDLFATYRMMLFAAEYLSEFAEM